MLTASWLLALALAAAPGEVRLAAVGDVLVARTVPQRLAAHGPAWFWERLGDAWTGADLRFANLECPVCTDGRPVLKRFCFRAVPEQARAVLQAGAVEVVALANNHAWDWGRTGLAQTLGHLRAWGIAAAGAGRGRAQAVAPVRLTRSGLRVAVVAYTDWTPEDYIPSDDEPSLATLDETTLSAELGSAHAEADVLVVSVHWGNEYVDQPTDRQRSLAHAMVEAGADLVLGHHPHVTQPVEVYRDRPIAYSLGNAIFDRSGPRVSNGLLLSVRLGRDAATVERQVALTIENARSVPAATGR
jgi:poly-gamma-glutamate synthesis protein (capsule biosynthesis protein)